MDLTGTAFGTAPTYTDYSSSLETGADGQPISVQWGRQDSESEIPPSTCSFVLDNTSGQWTPGNAAADVDWDVGVPVNARVLHDSVTYDRFTGFVDSIEPAYPGQSWSRVLVTCSDVTARLGRANPLRSLLLHEMLADSPTYLYPLAESVGASAAADIVSSSNPTATVRNAVTLGADLGLFDGGTGADLGDSWSTNSAYGTNAAVNGLSVAFGNTVGPFVPNAAFTVEAWAVTPASAPGGSADPAVLLHHGGTTSTDASVFIKLHPTTGYATFTCIDVSANEASPAGTTNLCDGRLHHFAGTLSGDRKTAKLYVDGALVASVTSGTAISLTNMRYNVVGGFASATGFGYQFPGSVALVALYPSEMSGARVLAHYKAGIGTGPQERTDQRFSRIAGYGGITVSGLPTGLGAMPGQKTSGLPAVDSLRLAARSEGAPMFATKAGALTMQSRQVRYNAAVAATITGADIDPDMVTRRDRQSLANEITVTNQGGAAQLVEDTTSKGKHGRFDAGQVDVSLASNDEALNLGQWQIATRKNPLTRLPDLTVDLLTGRTNALVTAVLGLDISSKVSVTDLPSQAPATSFTGFIEGGSEQWGADTGSIGFFTTPVTLEDSLFTLDDATKGQLNSTYVLAF